MRNKGAGKVIMKEKEKEKEQRKPTFLQLFHEEISSVNDTSQTTLQNEKIETINMILYAPFSLEKVFSSFPLLPLPPLPSPSPPSSPLLPFLFPLPPLLLQ